MADNDDSTKIGDDEAAATAKFVGFSTRDGERIEEKPTAPAKASKPVEPKEQEAEPDHEDDADEAKPAEPKSSAQARINKAVSRQRAAERDAEARKTEIATLTARLEALEKGTLTKTETKNKTDPDAPNPKDYTYGELDAKFIADVARYETRKTIAEEKAAQTKSQETARETKAREASNKAFEEFSDKGAAKYDDFQELVVDGVTNAEWPCSQFLAQLILESEFGPDIAYALASDRKEAKRIDALTPSKQAAWFGRMEAKLEDESPEAEGADQDDEPRKQALNGRKTPQAPAPLRHQTRGAGSQGTSPATSDFSAFEAMATGKR